jgi:hypothetical protein
MRSPATLQRRLVLIAATAMLLIGIGTARTAVAEDSVERCPSGETLVNLEPKTCPPNNKRPAIVVRRACCQKKNGTVHCKSFPHCPRTSPS